MSHVYGEKFYLVTRKQLQPPSGGRRGIVRPHSRLPLLAVTSPPLSLGASAAHTSWSVVMTAVVQRVQLGFYHHRFCGE